MIGHKQMNNSFTFKKIHFSITKKVRFGQAIYVCGNIAEFGMWSVQSSFRLSWNQGNVWTGVCLLHTVPKQIQYKYVIGKYDNPVVQTTLWEVGKSNRKMTFNQSKKNIICDDQWNMERISLHLKIDKKQLNQDQKFYVVGDIYELGVWKYKKEMRRVLQNESNSDLQQLRQRQKENINHTKYTTFNFSFSMYRDRQKFRYYYLKVDNAIRSERKPGRTFWMTKQKKYQPYRLDVNHFKGQISIVEEINIDNLIFSNITDQISVGCYLKNSSDVAKLKEEGISAILSIQSQKDFVHHGLSEFYLKLLCDEHGVKYHCYSIEDMDSKDFINKAEGAVKIMRTLMKDGQRVYVHCSAGIYRSPQIIALYLTLFQGYSIKDAIEVITQKHPYAMPNENVINEVLWKLFKKISL